MPQRKFSNETASKEARPRDRLYSPAAQQATALQALVSSLQTSGGLNQGQANSLIVKLNLHGNEGDLGKVQAFLHEVAAYLNAGILTQAEADELAYWGNILLLGVTQR